MLERLDSRVKEYIDVLAQEVYPEFRYPVSREHYLERCSPVINRILASKIKTTVVDAGCGHAYEAILFAALGAHVIGVDLREDGFEVAVRNVARFRSIFPSLSLELINTDVFSAMRTLKPDVIWARQAISHIHPAEKFIEAAYDCLGKNGLLVINDSNFMNPVVIMQITAEHWKCKKQLRWFVIDKYRDPVTKAVVPYAVERMLTANSINEMFQKSGFEVEALDITGFIPGTVAAKLPKLTLRLESVSKRLPIISNIGAEYTISGRKNI
jgi:SAM-dependent methyltransferase